MHARLSSPHPQSKFAHSLPAVRIDYLTTICPLHAQAVKPRDFAMQINLAMENCWGIVRALVDVVAGLSDGKWLLVKDPNKPLLRLYDVPADAFKVRD